MIATVRQVVPASLHVKPLKQGNLSRLCGLYSLINAAQLVLYPRCLSKAELQELYSTGVEHLSRHRQLKRVMASGMTDEDWLLLWEGLAEHINAMQGTSLALKPALVGTALRSRRGALERIRKVIQDRSPVLACLAGVHDHYTVISGYTDYRLHLFDSSDLQYLSIASVGLGEESGHRHWISPNNVMVMTDDW